MRRLLGIALATAVLTTACGGGSERVVVAAGTTLVDSGFLDAVVEAYVADTGAERISVLGRSSKEAISLGASGDADMLITHEPVALYEFLTTQPDAIVTEPFASRFVIVAPPRTVIEASDAIGVFEAVAATGTPFISRDDGSGTHAREMSIWEAADIDPVEEPWYTRAGAGMGATLLVASDREAVTLAELGAFLSAASALDLVEVSLEDVSGLENPYQATVVNPDSSPGAAAFQAWLSTEAGRSAIQEVNLALFGFVVYEVA